MHTLLLTLLLLPGATRSAEACCIPDCCAASEPAECCAEGESCCVVELDCCEADVICCPTDSDCCAVTADCPPDSVCCVVLCCDELVECCWFDPRDAGGARFMSDAPASTNGAAGCCDIAPGRCCGS